MARFSRKINKQNKTVTVTDQMTGESVTGRYHDSLSAEKAADLIEGDLVQKEARPRVSDETSTAMQTRQFQDQSGANQMSREGFLSRQRLLNSRTQADEESPLQRARVGVSPSQSTSSPTGNVNQGEARRATMPSRLPPGVFESVKAARSLNRSNAGPDTPEQTPIQRRTDPLQGKSAFMNMADQKRAQKPRNLEEARAMQEQSNKRIIADDSFETRGKPVDFSEALTRLEGGNLEPEKASGLLEEMLMSDTSPKLMEESIIRGDDPVNFLTEDIVRTSGQAAQADVDAGLEQEDARFAEAQRRRNIMRGTGSEGTVAGSEDAAKFGQGAELEVKNLQRKAPHLFEEGTIKADDPPERIEALTLQVEAAAGNKKAQKEQKELYSQFKDPQVRAQVKEELGNYYIDPISGRPINLESLRKSPKRQRDMKMIAMFPEHMRPHALANMGYLDREDIPVDYKHMLKRDQLTFDMSKWSAEHSEKNRQFNATLDFKQKAQKDLEKRLGRKLTLEEKTQNDLNADRDYKQLWDNINGLIKEGNSPAATLLAKGAGLKLNFNANTAIQTEILEQMSDAKSAGINHPQGEAGTKAYFKFASDVHQKLITPRGDNISGDTYFDKALRAAGIAPYRESGYEGPEHMYNSLYYDKAYAAMMLRSPHSAFHKAVTNNNIAINLGGSTGNTTGGNTGPKTGSDTGGNNQTTTKETPGFTEETITVDQDSSTSFGTGEEINQIEQNILNRAKGRRGNEVNENQVLSDAMERGRKEIEANIRKELAKEKRRGRNKTKPKFRDLQSALDYYSKPGRTGDLDLSEAAKYYLNTQAFN